MLSPALLSGALTVLEAALDSDDDDEPVNRQVLSIIPVIVILAFFELSKKPEPESLGWTGRLF